MIEIQTKIHDKFSIEFKVGFSGREGVKMEYFNVNSWIFIPNGLYINKNTYSKDRFYTDIKSNIRLITPSFSLRQMAEGDDVPLHHVVKALETEMHEPNEEHLNEFKFQLKLFGSIFKSSIRDESAEIISLKDSKTLPERCATYIADLQRVLKSYRSLNGKIDPKNEEMLANFGFTDEFISHQMQIRTMKIIKVLQNLEGMDDTIRAMVGMLKEEIAYKSTKGYSRVIINDDSNNRRLMSRHSMLKKYIESALFLNVNTTQDGKAVKQISFSLAAGLAMMVSMLAALPFQKYLGNYPNLIFFILIIIYMLKDRIKELTRWLFAYQLKDKYYDNKTVVKIKNRPIGKIKEGMDFISEDKIPAKVLELRGRTKLEADNLLLDEKIILYRKRVEIDNKTLKNQYDYEFKGINDIIRYHVNYLTKKMDNPETLIDCLDEQGRVQTIKAERVYTLHFVLQFQWENQTEYRSFHVNVNRNGIVSISS